MTTPFGRQHVLSRSTIGLLLVLVLTLSGCPNNAPLRPVDVTSLFVVNTESRTHHGRTEHVTVKLQARNASISGSLSLVAALLPAGVVLEGASGSTPNGSPYIDVPLRGGKVDPGQDVPRIKLSFRIPSGTTLSYALRIFSDKPILHPLPPSPPPAPSVTFSIAAGAEHVCALTAAGGVECWGDNGDGQLGTAPPNTTFPYLPMPHPVSGLTNVAQVSSAPDATSTCALTGATVECWGANDQGQLGTGNTQKSFTPISVSGLPSAVAVGAGELHTCAVLTSGGVECWGNNQFGQLGNGTTVDSTIPVVVSSINNASAVATGLGFSCALLQTGALECWGAGALGNTTTSSTTPIPVTGISNAVSISAGLDHACAVLADGTAQCWGNGYHGELGNGSSTTSRTPVVVTGLSTAIAIAAGAGHTCAVLSNGSTQCWGDNSSGQLGSVLSGNNDFSTTPVTVSGVSNAMSVAAGDSFVCVQLSDGNQQCWGDNQFGALGNGQAAPETTFFSSFPVFAMRALLSSSGATTCGVLQSGQIKCWGSNANGTLGNGSSLSNVVAIPGVIPSIANAIGLSTAGGGNSDHLCAILADSTVTCWGNNYFNQLGPAAPPNNSAVPVPVPGMANVSAITAGMGHTCALVANFFNTGGVYCWGDNVSGILGPNGNSTGVPVLIPGTANATSVAAGSSHNCALMQDGTVSCWGANTNGQIGLNPAVSRFSNLPSPVQGINTAVQIASGANHSCALLSSGSIVCWGANGAGQLDNGNAQPVLTDSFVPLTVTAPGPFVAMGLGSAHTCGLLISGQLFCWGDDTQGELGDGNGNTQWSQVPLIPKTTVTFSDITAGTQFTCAASPTGPAQCWGSNTFSQLGTAGSPTCTFLWNPGNPAPASCVPVPVQSFP